MLNEVELDEWNSLVTISLTVSKTDQYARGCKRTLGCRCNAKEPVVCPYCVAGVLVNHQEAMSGIEHGAEAAANWPLIGQEGDPSKLVPKESMLAALKEDAIYLKDRGWLKDTTDMDLVSGHSLRRSGVKHWVKAGVPEELIMFSRGIRAQRSRLTSKTPGSRRPWCTTRSRNTRDCKLRYQGWSRRLATWKSSRARSPKNTRTRRRLRTSMRIR